MSVIPVGAEVAIHISLIIMRCHNLNNIDAIFACEPFMHLLWVELYDVVLGDLYTCMVKNSR